MRLYILRMTIDDEIDKAMRLCGLRSQSELSRISGVPQPTINRTLKGLTVPEFGTLKKLADTLGPDPVALLQGDTSDTSHPTPEKIMVDGYVRRIAALLDGRSEEELSRIVRGRELLLFPTAEAANSPTSKRQVNALRLLAVACFLTSRDETGCDACGAHTVPVAPRIASPAVYAQGFRAIAKEESRHAARRPNLVAPLDEVRNYGSDKPLLVSMRSD
ncbi:helix-turn-helix domain-containing protein [Burkholderia pyrrocinia]|uniref:helix-turn-helix domain-containing protein n=1 Tax=Burkholderia pyrrocinia TaxID=60550 RepID=UPI0038B5786D